MSNEQMISEIYRVIGLLEGVSMVRGYANMESVVYVLNDCIDRLELVGTQMLAKDVQSDEQAEKKFFDTLRRSIKVPEKPDQ